MKKFAPLAASAAIALTLSTCKQRTPASAAKADFVDDYKQGGRAEKYQSRRKSLQRYADCLLEPYEKSLGSGECQHFDTTGWPDLYESVQSNMKLELAQKRASENLSALGIGPHVQRLLPTIKGAGFAIRIGELGECFPETGDWFGDEAQIQEIVNQTQEVAKWIADFYSATHGAPSGYILVPKIFEICSTNKDSKDFFLSVANRTLRIKMPKRTRLGANARYLTVEALSRMWRSGSQISFDNPRFNAIAKLLWRVADPMGVFRSLLRERVKERKLEMLTQTTNFQQGRPLVELDSYDMLSNLTTFPKEELREMIPEDKIDQLLTEIKQQILSANIVQPMMGKSLEDVKPCKTETEVDDQRDLVGLIVVENAHHINICIDGVSTIKHTRNIRARGLIVVSTTDDVNVSASALAPAIAKIESMFEKADQQNFIQKMIARRAAELQLIVGRQDSRKLVVPSLYGFTDESDR